MEARAVLAQVLLEIEIDCELTEGGWIGCLTQRLRSVLPDATIRKAYEIVLKSGVVRVEAERSGRAFYKVEGQLGKEYHVLPELVSCSCAAFEAMLKTHSSLMCKHLLAAALSAALHAHPTVFVPDADFSFYFLEDRG